VINLLIYFFLVGFLIHVNLLHQRLLVHSSPVFLHTRHLIVMEIILLGHWSWQVIMVGHAVNDVCFILLLASLLDLLHNHFLVGETFIGPICFIDAIVFHWIFEVSLNLSYFLFFNLEWAHTLSVVHDCLRLKCLCDVILLSTSKYSFKFSFCFEVSEALKTSSMYFFTFLINYV
jgi:hypothetical protein